MDLLKQINAFHLVITFSLFIMFSEILKQVAKYFVNKFIKRVEYVTKDEFNEEMKKLITKEEHEKDVNAIKEFNDQRAISLQVELGTIKGIILVVADKVGVDNNSLKELVKFNKP